MKTLNYIHLDASKVSIVISGLQQLLADYQVFYTNLRGFHWNIKGHAFFVLHSKFEEYYDDAAGKIDEIAERILMLGGEPVNAFSEYLQTARIKEVSGVSCGEEALKNILDSYSLLIEEERAILASASGAKDESTVSLMSDYLKKQEKTVWMLVAFSSGDCKNSK
jgi:starvation-inducible DNA-binding protein